jgi:arabinan endo-1,5-alpha-L-arabinosidase
MNSWGILCVGIAACAAAAGGIAAAQRSSGPVKRASVTRVAYQREVGVPRSLTSYAYPPPLLGDVAKTPDPSMLIRDGKTERYVVFSTGNETRESTDRVNFTKTGFAIPKPPSWWSSYDGGASASEPCTRLDLSVWCHFWAPDVSHHNGEYWMYYSVAGNGKAAIGLATSPTGDPGSWADQGLVRSSVNGDPDNAIDPSLLVDGSGNWWLTYGSYRSGIYVLRVNPATGKPYSSSSPLNVAQRPGIWLDPIEGSFIYRHRGYYYLFAAFDYCCRGSLSSYSIRVGRSVAPTGPYADESGRRMLDGGGTPVEASHDWVRGPGAPSVYFDDFDKQDLLIYHYYDARNSGQVHLGINSLGWDGNGFPYAK